MSFGIGGFREGGDGAGYWGKEVGFLISAEACTIDSVQSVKP